MTDHSSEKDLNTQIQYRLIEKLSESEKRYRDLVENLREIVFKCDRTGKILFLNQAWSKTLGYSVADSISMPLENFVAVDDLGQFANLLASLEVDQRADQLFRFRHQSDRVLYLELYAQKNSQQEISGSMVDVTTREEASHLLSQAKDRLEARVAERTAALAETNQELTQTLKNLESLQGQLIQAEKMSSMGQLVAGIAHEINNPINFIHGNLFYAHQHTEVLSTFIEGIKTQFQANTQIQDEFESLEIDFILNDLPAIFKSMRNGTDRIANIVASLRNFARLNETGIKKIDIHEGLESTVLILQHRFKNESDHQFIDIIRSYSKLPVIACDAGQLNQVFMNVLTNAIDALEERRQSHVNPNEQSKLFQVQLTTRVVDSEQIEIAIADNGPGIPKAIQSKIFDPFFTTKSVGKGTGMGLAISHQIITENHGGSLEVQSTPDHGTEVRIRLPIQH
ncbi:MAG: ATP-binding protein [Leptolyngbyaceae cyanobacterium]